MAGQVEQGDAVCVCIRWPGGRARTRGRGHRQVQGAVAAPLAGRLFAAAIPFRPQAQGGASAPELGNCALCHGEAFFVISTGFFSQRLSRTTRASSGRISLWMERERAPPEIRPIPRPPRAGHAAAPGPTRHAASQRERALSRSSASYRVSPTTNFPAPRARSRAAPGHAARRVRVASRATCRPRRLCFLHPPFP